MMGYMYKMPWYPNDKVIMLESACQSKTTHQLLISLHRADIPYLLKMGTRLYTNLATAYIDNFDKQLEKLHLDLYNVERWRVEKWKWILNK